MQFPFITYGMVLYKRQYTDKHKHSANVYMRASLENFGLFTFLNCYFLEYFVGTSDTLSVQMTCLLSYMYRQISKCTDKFSSVPTKLRKSYANARPCKHV